MLKLQVLDLMQAAFWGVGAAIPLGLSVIAGEDDHWTLIPAFVFQVAFGVACYVAGVRA